YHDSRAPRACAAANSYPFHSVRLPEARWKDRERNSDRELRCDLHLVFRRKDSLLPDAYQCGTIYCSRLGSKEVCIFQADSKAGLRRPLCLTIGRKSETRWQIVAEPTRLFATRFGDSHSRICAKKTADTTRRLEASRPLYSRRLSQIRHRCS